MKKLATIILLASGLAASAPAAITAGLEAGYLLDGKDAYWAGRFGWELTKGLSLSHQVEIELGYTEHSESESFSGFSLEANSRLTPLTINYRVETTRATKLNYYFGAGLGQAKVEFNVRGSGVPNFSDHSTAFAVQAFTGLSYQVASATTLHVGLKYLWVDEVDLFGANDIEIGDDFALTAGISVKF